MGPGKRPRMAAPSAHSRKEGGEQDKRFINTANLKFFPWIAASFSEEATR